MTTMAVGGPSRARQGRTVHTGLVVIAGIEDRQRCAGTLLPGDLQPVQAIAKEAQQLSPSPAAPGARSPAASGGTFVSGRAGQAGLSWA